MSEIELEIPPRVQYLALVRAVITSAASLEPAMLPGRIEDLRLAVSEATTNAVEAHLDAGIELAVRIRCEVGDGRVQVEVCDRGAGFDPQALVPHPPVTDPERLQFERGLGVSLMRKLTDKHEIESGPDGTTVRMTVVTDQPRDKLP